MIFELWPARIFVLPLRLNDALPSTRSAMPAAEVALTPIPAPLLIPHTPAVEAPAVEPETP